MNAQERGAAKAVRVEVIAYAPTAFYHCQHCEVAFQEVGFGQRLREEQLAHALPEDLLHDYQALSDGVRALTEYYGGQVVVKVIDAASVEGFWKSLRYGVRRYPAVIVEGKGKCSGTDWATVRRLIERYLPAPSPAGGRSVGAREDVTPRIEPGSSSRFSNHLQAHRTSGQGGLR